MIAEGSTAPWLRSYGFVLLLATLGGPLHAAPRPAPTDPIRSARWNRALQAAAELAKGRTGKALTVIERARRAHDSPALATAAALCRVLMGHHAQAREAIRRATSLRGTWLDAHYWQAVLELQAGRLAEAKKALHHAQTLGGDRPHYLMLRALLARRAGQAGAARQAMTRLAKVRCDLLDPQLYPDPLAGIAGALHHLLRDFPQPAAALLSMGNLLWVGRRYRQAEAYYRAARAKLPHSPAVLMRMARMQLSTGDAPAALRLVTRAIAQAPEAAALYGLRAEVYLQLGKTAAARADLERSVRGDPRIAANLSRLARLLWDTGAYRRAEQLYRYALKRQSRLAAARFGIAQALDRKRRYAEATAAYRAAAALSPANERYHLAYALHLEKLGKSVEAKRVRRRAQRAAAIAQQVQRRARDAVQRGGSLRRVCRVAAGAALHAARIMERRLKAPAAVRAFLRAHLAARAGGVDPMAVAQATAGLRPNRLIWLQREPPSVLTVQGRIEPGVPVVVKQFLLFVNPARFR